jgi:uncharacterized membrane protein
MKELRIFIAICFLAISCYILTWVYNMQSPILADMSIDTVNGNAYDYANYKTVNQTYTLLLYAGYSISAIISAFICGNPFKKKTLKEEVDKILKDKEEEQKNGY